MSLNHGEYAMCVNGQPALWLVTDGRLDRSPFVKRGFRYCPAYYASLLSTRQGAIQLLLKLNNTFKLEKSDRTRVDLVLKSISVENVEFHNCVHNPGIKPFLDLPVQRTGQEAEKLRICLAD